MVGAPEGQEIPSRECHLSRLEKPHKLREGVMQVKIDVSDKAPGRLWRGGILTNSATFETLSEL